VDRRKFIERLGQAALLAFYPGPLLAKRPSRRRRPSDADWPSQAAWNRLRKEVEGRLIPVEFPIAQCVQDTEGAACKDLLANINNPYFIGDHPGLTQTLGWVDAWFTKCRQGVDASLTPTFYMLLSSASARESTSNSTFGTVTGQ